MEQEQLFEMTTEASNHQENIVVFGVGGGGGNALNHIIDAGLQGVEFVAANTDAKALAFNKAGNKIILGEKLTRGLGAGADPKVGESAAKESLDKIRDFIHGADMLFITAGMGGGTGTGAAPEIAKLAREENVLVVGVVTLPFGFEMKKRYDTAQGGITRLRDNVDALLVVENDKLLGLSDAATLKLSEAYKMVDEVLRQAVQGVTDLITKPGFVNVDFADIKTVMQNAGTAIMGIGEGDGENSAEKAAKAAIESPLMSVPVDGAKGILFNVTTGTDVTLIEMSRAAEVIKGVAAEDANVIWGHVIDDQMGDKVRVTLIATGFPDVKAKTNTVSKTVQPPRQKTSAAQPPQPNFRHDLSAFNSGGIPSLLRKPPSDSSLEEANLTAQDGNDDQSLFATLPKMPYDTPSIFRRDSRE